VITADERARVERGRFLFCQDADRSEPALESALAAKAAAGLPSIDGGRLITLEARAKHADVARRNVVRAGLAGKVEIRTGAALKTLPEVEGLGRSISC
jgi:hypothetical protein